MVYLLQTEAGGGWRINVKGSGHRPVEDACYRDGGQGGLGYLLYVDNASVNVVHRRLRYRRS